MTDCLKAFSLSADPEGDEEEDDSNDKSRKKEFPEHVNNPVLNKKGKGNDVSDTK